MKELSYINILVPFFSNEYSENTRGCEIGGIVMNIGKKNYYLIKERDLHTCMVMLGRADFGGVKDGLWALDVVLIILS